MSQMSSIAIVGFLLFLSGCGHDGYAELGLVPVTGTVTLDDKPLADAKVVFEDSELRQATGTTDDSGNYTLMYDSNTPGATPGPKTVRITLVNVQEEGGGAAEGAVPAKETIPARYNIRSELKADVSSSAKVFSFDLKSTP
jgi:hypothetical protein